MSLSRQDFYPNLRISIHLEYTDGTLKYLLQCRFARNSGNITDVSKTTRHSSRLFTTQSIPHGAWYEYKNHIYRRRLYRAHTPVTVIATTTTPDRAFTNNTVTTRQGNTPTENKRDRTNPNEKIRDSENLATKTQYKILL